MKRSMFFCYLMTILLCSSCGVALDDNSPNKNLEKSLPVQNSHHSSYEKNVRKEAGIQSPQEVAEDLESQTDEEMVNVSVESSTGSQNCNPSTTLIGPGFCNSVTLKRVKNSDETRETQGYYLRVDFATVDKLAMEFQNETTGDIEHEFIYFGNPSFTLSYGVRGVLSFSVVPGENRIRYSKFKTINDELTVVERGYFTLHVSLSE